VSAIEDLLLDYRYDANDTPRLRCPDGSASATTGIRTPALVRDLVRLQPAIGNERAEMPHHDLERLENRPLLEELAVILGALTVVAAPGILGRKMVDCTPTPATRCCCVEVDRRCQLVVATFAHVAKAVEMAVLRLDEPEPRVPERVSPVQGLEQWRVHLAGAVRSDRRPLAKTCDRLDVTANKPGTGCSLEDTHLRARSFWTVLWSRDEFGRSRKAWPRSKPRIELDREHRAGRLGADTPPE
jgi:hypothetical protein